MRERREIPLICLGMGKVGGALLQQMLEYGNVVARQTRLSLVPVVIADSGGALVDPERLSEKKLRAVSEAIGKGEQLESLPGYQSLPSLDALFRPGMIVIDTTASAETHRCCGSR